MCIYRVKKATPRHAIRTRTSTSGRIQRSRETGSVIGSTIATDDVTACVSNIMIVGAELYMLEYVERFLAELGIAAFRFLEVLQKVQIEVYAVWIVQKF